MVKILEKAGYTAYKRNSYHIIMKEKIEAYMKANELESEDEVPAKVRGEMMRETIDRFQIFVATCGCASNTHVLFT
jgi:hypothetical protein